LFSPCDKAFALHQPIALAFAWHQISSISRRRSDKIRQPDSGERVWITGGCSVSYSKQWHTELHPGPTKFSICARIADLCTVIHQLRRFRFRLPGM
jgi:hypothetical protein